MNQRLSRVLNRDHQGFTLIELLVVIVILGVLSAVVVFAVRGIGDKGQAAAVRTDERTIRTAEEIHCAKFGTYATGQGLVDAKLLSDLPTIHTVEGGDDIAQFPMGSCPSAPVNKHYKLACADGSAMPDCGVPGVATPPAGSDLEAAWATYLGDASTDIWIPGPGTGSGLNRGPQVAADAQGNVYVTGHVLGGFPTQAASQPLATSAFVAKFSPTGALVYSTYLGNGSGGDGSGGLRATLPEDIAVDAAGNAYVVGTNGTDTMPTTPNAYRPLSPVVFVGLVPGGVGPVTFLTKLDPLGVPVYSTYLWPSHLRGGYDVSPAGVALLGPDKVLVTGLDYKAGPNDSSRLDAYRAPCGTALGGTETGDVGAGQWRGFLTLMDTSKAGVDSHVATTCGGDGKGIGGRAVAVTDVTAAGATAYVLGDDPAVAPRGLSKVAVTLSPTAPTPVLQVLASRPELPGFALATTGTDVYVFNGGPTVKRLDAALGLLDPLAPVTPQTYSAPGQVLDIAAGPGGVLYEIGYGGGGTITPPPGAKAYQKDYGGGSVYPGSESSSDAYLFVMGPSGAVSYATYLGGGGPNNNGLGNEKGTGIAVGPGGDVYVTGTTNSDTPSFPTKNAYQASRLQKSSGAGGPAFSHDLFAARFRPGPVVPGSTTTTLLPTVPTVPTIPGL